MNEPQCPMCPGTPMPKNEAGDWACPSCGREWYEATFDGESSLASRRRKVNLLKLPEEGDRMADCIVPAKPWVQPPPIDPVLQATHARVDSLKPEDFTCFRCAINTTCPYAWDPYNTAGDCLAEK